MDLKSFASTSTSVESTLGSSEDESHSECEEPSQPKKHCGSITTKGKKGKYCSKSSTRKYCKIWEKTFDWLDYDKDRDGAFCKICKKFSSLPSQKSGGVWVTKPFSNWKKGVEKMKAHEKSSSHCLAKESALAAEGTLTTGSVFQQLQRASKEERLKNRAAVKSLMRCTHFLVRNHMAHTTNFEKLVDLVVSCGGDTLAYFMANTAKNAAYTSHVAVVEFVEALGTWVEECTLKRLQKAPYYSIMADECTDIACIEELSLFCRWEEDGIPEEHFLEIIHLKKSDATSIYSALIECLKEKNLQVNKIIGMGFDGASTFSGKKSGVQTRIKAIAPHALFVHCRCHLLQLACVQAANSTPGIKHVYTTLTSLWKFFHYSPKRTESLKEVQHVFDMPELKVLKPSDTRWLAHEKCLKVVKASYAAIVTALDNIHDSTHAPEALGLSKALSKQASIAGIFLLDYTLPQLGKLSRTLQTESLDLTMISTLVEATLIGLDEATLPSANWVLELMDEKSSLELVTGIAISSDDIQSFQEKVAKPFIELLKCNISNRFSSSGDVVRAMSIFDPKIPCAEDSIQGYGEDYLHTLLDHYGTQKVAKTLDGEDTVKQALISADVCTEWKTYKQYLVKQPKENMKLQLKELAANDMLKTMFPNLNVLARISLTIPVTTASVERSFSQMKLIKTRLRSCLKDSNLSYLMKIAIETSDKLTDSELEGIVDIWSRKTRRIAV